MTLQLRRTEDARFGVWTEWANEPIEIDTYELVERIERDFHRYHDGPMFMCPDDDCISWVDWLRDQGVIF